MQPEQLRDLVVNSLENDKGEDIVVIDLRGKSAEVDYMIIASGRSTTQVGAMAEKLRQKVKAETKRVPVTEGVTNCDWVLVDLGDIVVHIFRPEVREFYNLEKMWMDPVLDDTKSPSDHPEKSSSFVPTPTH